MQEFTPGPLGNFGFGALALWACVNIVDKLLAHFRKRDQPVAPIPIKIEFVADPTVEFRLNSLDKRVEGFIPRQEFDSFKGDLLRQLARMEGKIDGLTGIRTLFTGKQDLP